MDTDYIVIGAGLAGLTSALMLADFGTVLLVSKKSSESSTNLAQGGIAAVTQKEDSFASHIQDTMIAGAGHNKKESVEFLVKNGPRAIAWLQKQGIMFDEKQGQEAAHSYRRISHVSDFTGQHLLTTLMQKIKNNPNITYWNNCFLVDLLVQDNHCYGAQLIKDKQVINIFSKATILVTGGTGQLYQRTTNPTVATGDGLAAAIRAGARVTNLEFIQFHPTALNHDVSPLFLLSEAIRGEGAYMVNEQGERFMEQYDARGELAPRDITARAIYNEQKHGKVFLDIRHKGKQFLQNRFPNIYKTLQGYGFDMATDLLPITPVAHYSCGGIEVNLFGQTSIENVYAFGEVSDTGVHGANRLASNSLLEAIVFPLTLPKTVTKLSVKKTPLFPVRLYVSGDSERSVEDSRIDSGQARTIKQKLQKIMWDYVGIVRTQKGLATALEKITALEKEIINEEGINEQSAEINNMILVAKQITVSAQKRKKSLGAHYMES